jgi:hypothetical protein
MKISFYLALLLSGLFLISSCGGNQQEQKAVNDKNKTIEVSVDSLLTDASALDGKIVKFTATVDHACMHGGKRLTVFGSIEGKTLKVDGTEKSPKFVSGLMGKKVEIIGTVKKVPGTHVADCEVDEGNEIPEVAYVIECIDYKEIE